MTARKIDVVHLKSVRLEAWGCSELLHYYSSRQREVLNSKYRWCVTASRLNFSTIVLYLHTQVDHKAGTILSNYTSISPSAFCYFHSDKRSVSGAPFLLVSLQSWVLGLRLHKSGMYSKHSVKGATSTKMTLPFPVLGMVWGIKNRKS